jgi:hypothetical protein
MRTELIPAADVRIDDCVLDDQGAPAVVTSTRWHGVLPAALHVLQRALVLGVFGGNNLLQVAVLRLDDLVPRVPAER